MGRVAVVSLNAKVREKIVHQAYSLQELQAIRAQLRRQIDQKQRGFSRALFITLLVAILVLGSSVAQAGTTPAIAVSGIVLAGILAFALLFSWYATIGRLKQQYNRAVRKGYPQMQDELRL